MRPRRILAKVEANRLGSNRRFVVTNLSGDPQGIYHGFYVQRGEVPEKHHPERTRDIPDAVPHPLNAPAAMVGGE